MLEHKELEDTFPFDGETKLDGENLNYISYLEYNLQAIRLSSYSRP